MISTKSLTSFFLTIFALMHFLQYNVQEWIRKEIDDDPEQEMFFPKSKKGSNHFICVVVAD